MNGYEVPDDEEDPPGTRGRLCVQADTEVVVAELPLDQIVVNDTWIEHNRKDPHHCEHEGQHNGMVGREREQNHAGNRQVEFSCNVRLETKTWSEGEDQLLLDCCRISNIGWSMAVKLSQRSGSYQWNFSHANVVTAMLPSRAGERAPACDATEPSTFLRARCVIRLACSEELPLNTYGLRCTHAR